MSTMPGKDAIRTDRPHLSLIRSCAALGCDRAHPCLHTDSADPLLAQITHGRGIETTIHIQNLAADTRRQV